MKDDARNARHRGRPPVISAEYRGWTLEVYRVGWGHRYQALGIKGGTPLLQGSPVGGVGARQSAGREVLTLIDREIASRGAPATDR